MERNGAATSLGIFKGNTKTSNLVDYKEWDFVTSVPTGNYFSVATLGNNAYASFEHPDNFQADTIFVYNKTVFILVV